MPRLEKEPRRFFRAAEQRMAEARFLLQHDYTTASIYLAGYGIECMLKVLILASEPQAHHPKTMRTFRGVHGHDFVWLREQLDQRRIEMAATIITALTRVNKWTTDLRYDPSAHNRQDAKVFLIAAEEITHWVRGRL